MKKIELSESQIQKIIKLYESGISMQNIGKSLGYSKPFINKVLLQEGVSVNRPYRISLKTIDNFIKCYIEMGSILKARQKVSIGQESALKIIRDYHLEDSKKCLYCGSGDLYTQKNGKTYPCCSTCKDIHFKNIEETRLGTVQNRYGVENIAQLKDIKKCKKKTNRERYGVEYPMQNSDIYKKHVDTIFKERGVTNIFQDKNVKQAIQENLKRQYGVVFNSQRPEVREKISQSHLNISDRTKIKRNNLRKKTMKTNWGYEYNSQVPSIQESKRESFKKKYGGTCSFDSPIIREKINKNKRIQYWNLFLILLSNKKLEALFDKEYYITAESNFTYRCLHCENIFSNNEITVQRISCGCLKSRSHYEDIIINWLRVLGDFNIKPNERFIEEGKYNYEIDIYLPDLEIGIDFHGIYWHCDLYKNKKYHQDKYFYFKHRGIQLIQIFESEWLLKENIVKSIIENKLGINSKIYARKCEIREVGYNDSIEFLMINHIQSYAMARINIGLYYEDALVCLATFGHSRFKKEDSWELIRFCTKLHTSLVGGFQKILKYFEIQYHPKALVSFVDLRYFNGQGYVKNGFREEYITNPNYFYFNNNAGDFILHSRIEFQKHKLECKLKKFDSTISEYKNMINNDYLRIFDAGNIKMIKTY